ncbi:uncharacterized protein [Diadema setosum]|uniref:uncharacterized protein n=1 Tax=Diadema setosum TaxID=31175 RepID=UPI003B3B8154
MAQQVQTTTVYVTPGPAQAGQTTSTVVVHKKQPNACRAAIPAMHIGMAVLCLILNICIPGLGTIVAGFSVYCCGNPGQSGGEKFGTMCLNFWIGILQLATTLIFLIGWIWAIAWGAAFIAMSSDYHDTKKTTTVITTPNPQAQPMIVTQAAQPQPQPYNMPPQQGYNMPPPQGYTVPQPQGYNVPQPQGYNVPPPQGYTVPPPQGYTVPQPQGPGMPPPQGYQQAPPLQGTAPPPQAYDPQQPAGFETKKGYHQSPQQDSYNAPPQAYPQQPAYNPCDPHGQQPAPMDAPPPYNPEYPLPEKS